jgi:hypothetical protein
MATLVLTTIGTVLGGPIGGAIGALAGQAVDSTLFRPAGRTGPRLADLQLQTSRYGAQIPRLFGTMRVAGTVIWATDLKEATATSGGGKGRPSVTSYSYSASFAVALSSRPILSISRIWADGNLLRGAAGDIKTGLGALRIHDGGAGQAADPLIAAAMGIDRAPAFRDTAYLVFEDLQLADYGNRIPSLTVEVVADADAVPMTTIAADLLGAAADFAGTDEPLLAGFAADGEDAGAALAALVEGFGLRWRYHGGVPGLTDGIATGRTLAADGELRSVDGRAEAQADRQRAPLELVPARLSLRHFDPQRDYQPGVQSAERAGPGTRTDAIDLPAVLSADAARLLAGRRLRQRLRERQRIARTHGWAALDLNPGDLLALEEEGGAWLVETLEWDDMAPRLSLRAAIGGSGAGIAAGDSGQPVLQPDLQQGGTRLAMVELPPLDDAPASAPLVFAAATGATAGWRKAALFRYDAETMVASAVGQTAPRAVIGSAMTALGPGAPWCFDLRFSVEVQLANDADSLADADDEELLRGANLCALGGELLQFGMAEPLGSGRYRLSRLIRGWHGTEWAASTHVVGEDFVMIEAERLAPLAMTPADAGMTVALRAIGTGDTDPAEADIAVDGRAMVPPAPVHGAAVVLAGGDIGLGWTRRSRQGWLWRDLGDVPLGEESETYRLTVSAGAQTLRSIDLTTPSWTYVAADLADDLVAAGADPLVVQLRQIGTYGPSRPLTLVLP